MDQDSGYRASENFLYADLQRVSEHGQLSNEHTMLMPMQCKYIYIYVPSILSIGSIEAEPSPKFQNSQSECVK